MPYDKTPMPFYEFEKTEEEFVSLEQSWRPVCDIQCRRIHRLLRRRDFQNLVRRMPVADHIFNFAVDLVRPRPPGSARACVRPGVDSSHVARDLLRQRRDGESPGATA